MSRQVHRLHLAGVLSAILVALNVAGVADAAFPPPANDTPDTAQPVGPLPVVVTGSNVNGDNTIDTTTLGGLEAVPGPDVFYTFTPAADGDVWIVMIPWIEVPVYASSGGTVPVPNLCVYVREAGTGTFVAGADENGRGVSDTVIASLSAGTEYEIVVDSTESVPRGQEFEFTLVVADAPTASAEDCTGSAMISAALPTAVVGTLTGAVDDFTFVEGTGRCDVADPFGTFLPGVDHVYAFTTGPDPSDAGDYVFTLVPGGAAWDGFLYVADSCPPFFPPGCLGAASHTSSTVRQAETVVVTLDYDTTYYVYVDAATLSVPDAKYALLVDLAAGYDVTEVEPNDDAVDASPVSAGAVGGQIVGGADEDYWSVMADAGTKLYAFVNNGNAALSAIDSELRLFAGDGTTMIEFDDDDGEGSDSPIPTVTWRSSAFSSTIAGARLFTDGTYYLKADTAGTNRTFARYRLHYGLQPPGRRPTPECEPNDTPGFADGGVKEFYAGTILVEDDADYFVFDATAGDWVYIALDGDPERDSGGDDADDPDALDAALHVLDPDGDVLIEDHDDVNAVDPDQVPDYPAEALVLIAPLSGTYTVRVTGSEPTDFGPGRTYELAVFRNNVTPDPAEDVDPVIDSITPDFGTDTVAVEASDVQAGDSGICDVSLAADTVNLEIRGLSLTPGDPTVTFDIGLLDPQQSGAGKVVITDCGGNTTCAAIEIDAGAPDCGGAVVVPGDRVFRSRHEPIHVPDNQPDGPGIDSEIEVQESGVVGKVTVTVTCETSRVPDLGVSLISPAGTRVDVVSGRGSSFAYNMTEATFDDDGEEMMSIFSSDEPYTGIWLPDDPGGLAQFNGEAAQGIWTLNVVDASSTSSGGSRLVRWSMRLDAGFPNPEVFEGTASDPGGLASVELVDADNVILNMPDDFTPGDPEVAYTVTLIDPSRAGTGTVVVTDISDNTCETAVSLVGLPDDTPPSNAGDATRDLVFGAEVQAELPTSDPDGVISSITVPDAVTVGRVLVDLTINTRDVGRLASTLTHDGEFASLINRVGMEERGGVGLTKDNLEIALTDDAPVEDDAHLEPALGSIEFIGPHQPDGRGKVIGDGIDDDDRDNMLFVFDGFDTGGRWDLMAGDFRDRPSTSVRSILRRWRATVVSPGAAERYAGTASEPFPESGICAIELDAGATNLTVEADFEPLDEEVDYVVTLVDPEQPGSGTLEITDCGGNTTEVPVDLAPAAADQSPPAVTGAVNGITFEFEGTATDDQPGDSGIASVELAPFANNLEIVSVTPDPPAGATAVDFVIGLVDPDQNGRGYVRVTDVTGYRRHRLVWIDASAPDCTGSIRRTRRYLSGEELPAQIPDDNPAGVSSSIVVPHVDRISDVDITVNITHPMDQDVDLTLTSPTFLTLFSDVGSTGNNFTDTTLDDEAAEPITAGSAPFTGSYQPEPPAMLSQLDGNPAAGTYTLRAVDDAVYSVGTFDNWSLTIESMTFPPRYDGRVEDSAFFDQGVCSIELLDDAVNLTLRVDAFEAGDAIVRYAVELTNPRVDGVGTVLIADCAGNLCDVHVCLAALPPHATKGDLNGDGQIDLVDYVILESCLDGPTQEGIECGDICRLADFDDDGDVDVFDFGGYQQVRE